MKQKVRVGAVSYLNTKPLIFGFENGMMADEVELVYDYPSAIARMLLEDEIDLGLVPVAVIPRMQKYHIISDYCIGASGKVASVCIFSEVPIEQVKQVLLDYQSRTSVALTKILLKEFWKTDPELIDAKQDFRSRISGTTAALVIGDRALQQRKISPYIYDLGEAWQKHTGLSFVFAAWISNKKLNEDFISAFNLTNKFGLDRIGDVVDDNPYDVFDLHQYFTKYIKYVLDDDKRKGLECFLKKIRF